MTFAGGWLQGGGLSTGLERRYGFGVDQILEIEMVLADGIHVKFGPKKWVKETGYVYPRTTEVTGYCNSNLVDDESKWKWTKCSKAQTPAVPFSDLWFAVRGGGGGTYGVVTAVQAQLHDFESLFLVYRDDSVLNEFLNVYCADIDCLGVAFLFFDYLVDLFWNPKNIGLSEPISNKCGNSGITFAKFFDQDSNFDGNFFFCEGSAARDAVIAAWKSFVTTKILPAYPGASIENFLISAEIGSYAEIVIQSTPGGRVPMGHIQDNPPPGTQSMGGYPLWSANVPIKWLVQKNDEVHNFLLNEQNSCHLIGGDSSKAHDQMTSINPFQRKSGLQCMISPYSEQHFRSQFLKYFKTSGGKFPGGTEYNHISATAVGPLKTNWTMPCPLSYSKAQQEKKCISLQESVWGTDILTRLKSIKKKVDPNSAFNCHFCVGEKPISSGK